MAPASAIPDCALTRTARIKSLSIRAFKSFGTDVQSFNFSKGFNLVVGANGSGKSNILDAICFVLCSKSSALRVGSVSELQSTDTKEPCEVSLDLQILGTSGEECELINLSVRILPNDVRQYKVNGKLKSMKEVKDFLKEYRLLLDETSAVVHQSSITELADKNSPLKLASIISAASGAGRWNKEVETANKELKSTRAGLEEIQENICLVESSIVEDNARLKKLLRAEQDIKELERVALEYETCIAREEVIRQEIILAEEEIKSLKKDAMRYQMQLQQCRKLITFAQNDAKTTKKQLETSVEDTGSGSGLETVKNALNDAKAEEKIISEALETLQIQVEEAQANKSKFAQKVLKSEREDVEQLIESKRTELHGLKTNLDQIDSSIERVAHEEKLQTEMILLDNEAIDTAERFVEEMKSEILKLQTEMVQAKNEEEKIRNDMQELPHSPDDEAVESDNIKDIHGYGAAKRNLLKMVAELNQLHSEQEGISLAEQVAIKERAEKLQVFKDRRASIIDSIDILMEGIEKSRKRVQEANEVVFQKVCHAFAEACNYLLPNKSVNIIKVGQHVEDGVKFTFSNRSQGSKNVPTEWKTSLEELSGGQRTLLSLAFLLTVAISGQSPLYLLDEIDAALDEENQNRVAKLIKNIVSKGSQVICVSHHFSFQQQSDMVIQVTKADGTTKLHQVYAGT